MNTFEMNNALMKIGLKDKTVRLNAQYTIPVQSNINIADSDVDQFIKHELAMLLAKQLLDEDLIEVIYSHDILNEIYTFKAAVEVIQK